jgi:NADPH2:quinone reductase
MKAIRVAQNGGPDVLRLEEVPTPTAGPGEALVKLDASGVNFIDVYQRSGQYKIPLPFTPGQEGAGTVVAVGDGVTDVAVGDVVAYTGQLGAYAEYAAVRASQLVKLPDGVTTHEGAAIMLQGMTAHYLATSTYPLQRGDWCLVHAAAGGVGLLLCQIAKMRGAHVIGTTSTPEKAALAHGAGADEVILYTQQDFEAATRRITNGAGVHVVYDSVGRTTFDQSLRCLRPRGMMVLFGQSSGPVPPFDLQTLNRLGSLFITRPTLANYIATREDLVKRATELFEWIRDGKLTVRIDRTYPLADAAGAHRALEARQTTGKVLLVP